MCFRPLLSKYAAFFLNSFPEAEKYEAMVRHMLNDTSLHEQVHRASCILEACGDTAELIALLRLGYKMNEEQKNAYE